MSIDIQQFHGTFFEESLEGLDAMESGLLNLAAGEPPDPEIINTVFRAAHSIKGGSATFGFQEIAGVTHLLETLLDQIRNGERAVCLPAIDLLLRSVDVLRSMIDAARAGNGNDGRAADELLRSLQALLARDGGGAAGADLETSSVAEPDPSSAGDWSIEFRPLPHLYRTGNDPLCLLRELHALGRCHCELLADSVPPFRGQAPDQAALGWRLSLDGAVEREAIDEVFAWVDGDCELRVRREDRAGSVPDAPPAAMSAPGNVVPILREASPGPPIAARQDGGSIRVSTQKVDALINLVGELVITQAMLRQRAGELEPGACENLLGGLEELERNTRDLQDAVMAVRMLPMEFAFRRFPRVVRDLATQLGKSVRLVTEGEATELDKSVIERIVDPLNHVVRNSIDHGIESPEQRLAAGKPAEGTIRLSAEHEGGNIVIRVCDDGRGLDRDRILRQARARGIEVAEDIDDASVWQLICAPGFSTAEAVTDVSGRGVGMDVVRRNILSLSGQLEISSEAGRGSSIVIRLPLTLAILDGMMVGVGGETFVLPLNAVVESMQVEPAMVRSVAGSGRVLNVRDEYIPLVPLGRRFGLQDDGRVELAVIVDGEAGKRALIVDELIGQQQVVIKNLESNYRKVSGVSGATILGDGTVALIVDVPDLAVDTARAA